jgi:Cd2+/Zn2+-exporting ATPase
VVEPSRGIAVWVACDQRVLGWLELADTPRPEAAAALRGLRALGAKRLVLLTGDREQVAARVAEELGFDAYEAEVLPERKAELVAEEQAAGRRVMMVGDGVNDALALRSADVGVAVGAVINEVALGGADIALMGNNLARLPQMVDLANRTRRTVNLNVFVGVGFSVLMLTLAAMGLISPLLGALLHNGGAIFVVVNSARLLTLSLDGGAERG